MSFRHTVVAALTTLGLACSSLVAGSAEAAPASAGFCSIPFIGPLCSPKTVVLDGDQLLRTKVAGLLGDRTTKTALKNLLTQANTDLGAGPWSVTSKSQLPPSGDKHDYLSLAPYWWASQPVTADNPWGCPFIQKDGIRNPLVDSITDHAYRGSAFSAIYRLTLAWYYTGDARYARRAALDLRTWFLDPATKMNPNMNFAQGIPCKFDGRGIGIIEFSYTLTQVVDATSILSSAGAPGWSNTDQTGMSSWYTQFLTWLRTNKNGTDETAAANNHGTFIDMMEASLALGTGQKDLAASLVKGAETRIDKQVQPDGNQPLEATRTRSWHYFAFNLVAMTRMAQIGAHVGVDLWHYKNPSGAGIFTAVDYLIPGATQGKSVWTLPELDFRPYAALDVLHAAADAGDKQARAAIPKVPVEPGGDLYPVRPAAEQLDDIATS
jgi:alginate lyase